VFGTFAIPNLHKASVVPSLVGEDGGLEHRPIEISLMAGLDPAIQIQSALIRWITGSRRFAAAR
jgi:hypothetical protein